MAFNLKHRKWIIVLLLAILLTLTIYMIKPYLSAIFVGSIIAYFLHPLYKRLKVKFSARVAQLTLALATVVVLILLITTVALPLAKDTKNFYDQTQSFVTTAINDMKNCENGSIAPICKPLEFAQEQLGQDQFEQKTKDLLQKTSLFIFQGISSVLSGVLNTLIFLFITAFSVFYFLEYGPSLCNSVFQMIPLSEKHKSKIFTRLKQTIDAVVGGNFIVAFCEGIIGGLIFYLVGIPSPLFWGLLMGILAFIPVIGPPLIWIPAAIALFVQGQVSQAIILAVSCGVILFSLENILKPRLIGGKINLSLFATFLGVAGGLVTFGILGLFFGPIIVALLVTISEIYSEI